MSLLPTPAHFGLPEKFRSWRRGQERAVLAALDSPRRFVAQTAPTGFGKTLTYLTQAILNGGRTAFLTASKGLQEQLVEDFGVCGLRDIRGQGNYVCRALRLGGEHYTNGLTRGDRCDAGPCHAGVFCSRRFRGCDYFDALQTATHARFVVTNYSYWIAQHRYSEGLGKFDLLVLDEAHDAAEELGASVEVEIADSDLKNLTDAHFPNGIEVEPWRLWASRLAADFEAGIDAINDRIRTDEATSADFRDRFALSRLLCKVGVVASMQGEWVIERQPHRVKFAPVWAARYAERFLFLNIPKVILVSATLRPKALELLGIQPDEYEFLEYPSAFPPARRPVIHVPSVRLRHGWSDVEQRTWVSRMDQIIDRRLDRKGIIHTGSYDRQKLILFCTRHADIMLFNDSRNTRATVEKFRQMSPPVVLVSPSMTTGWDLPLDACEYAIIGKIPFPDTRSGITRSRTEADPDYGPYLAMQTIVQASGRGMRSAEDQCEVFVVDDHWQWFWPKYKHFAPDWFIETVRRSATVPNPLPKLKEK